MLRIHDLMLAEFDRETGATRRVLARVPDTHLNWRPHERSRSLGELAAHVADLPGWAAVIATTTAFDLGEAPRRLATDASAAALLARFDAAVTRARGTLAAQSDAELEIPWSLSRAGRPVLTVPRGVAVRVQIVGHMVHHRGQLTVYLRLLDIPVPPVYGPSADEGTF
ncbi:MAG TPA: DinB family protein [Methylomirabilota bacterium]